MQYSMGRNRHNGEDVDNASTMVMLKNYLFEEVDGEQSTAPLSAYCFMTGFIDSVVFSAIFIWCAFQTGNSLKLALALARLCNGQHDYSFHIADRQALCSMLTFIFGAFIGRLGDKLGCKTRLWLALGTFIQALFTMAAAVAIWQSHEASVANTPAHPVWTNVLSFACVGFMSASMGLQAIMGKRINTQFTTTVVLTSTWCELIADPKLFDIQRIITSRDHKIMAIASLFLGGCIGRVLVNNFGSAATLGIGAGIRLIISVWWLFIPEEQGRIRL
jgi:MFS family permease